MFRVQMSPYKGEPVVIAMQLDAAGSAQLGLSGRIGNREWSVAVPLARAQPGAGISKVWARRKIRYAEIGMRLGRIDRTDGEAVVLKTALAHHLMSRLTSLVAVEDEIARPVDQPLTRADVPLNLPAGWDFEKVFGPRGGLLQEARWTGDSETGKGLDGRAQTGSAQTGSAAQPAPDAKVPTGKAQGRAGVRPSAVANVHKARFASVATRSAPVRQLHSQVQAVSLPRTATPAQLLMMAGAVLLLAGLTWLLLGPVLVSRLLGRGRQGEAS